MEQHRTFFKETYDHLKLSLLQTFAKQWAKRHPCICRITLYLAGPEHNDTDIQYILVANAPKYPEQKIPKDENEWTEEDKKVWEIQDYHNWTQKFDFHIEYEIGRIYKKNPSGNYAHQWMWFSLGPDETIEDYNLDPKNDFVLADTGFIIYDRDTKETGLEDPFQSLFMDNRKRILKDQAFYPQQKREYKKISGERDLAFEKVVWNEKIQPISDRCFNGEFQYTPCPDILELTNESIVLVHNKIFQMFNKLINFTTQLNQMAPSIDQGRQAKELVLSFDDIVLKKFRAGLGSSEKNELLFDFLQDIYDTNTMPAFLTYLGNCCNVTVNASETGETDSDKACEKRQSPIEIHPPIGTTWDQIKIRYVNDDHVEIAHPGIKTHAPYSMADLGMDTKPMLAGLFRLLAQYRGVIPANQSGVKANLSNLRKHLKQIFPDIEGPPIANYHKTKGYVCSFVIS